MRLVQFYSPEGVRLGLVLGDKVVDVRRAAEAAGKAAQVFTGTRQLLEAGDDAWDFVQGLRAETFTSSLSALRLAPPVFAKKIVAVGLNYADHAREAGLNIPATPLCFAKFASSLAGPYDAIKLPSPDAQVDYEGELGVVIGKTTKHVTEENTMSHVAGYLAFNDVSARKWQFDDGQWTRGKSCDTFSPNGPWLVTADEIPDPGALRITTRVNGQTLQDSNTCQLIFGVSKLVSYFSHAFTLEPGDIIATGTPPGVGFSRNPPIFLQSGDVVEVEIERIGLIRNPVEVGYEG